MPWIGKSVTIVRANSVRTSASCSPAMSRPCRGSGPPGADRADPDAAATAAHSIGLGNHLRARAQEDSRFFSRGSHVALLAVGHVTPHALAGRSTRGDQFRGKTERREARHRVARGQRTKHDPRRHRFGAPPSIHERSAGTQSSPCCSAPIPGPALLPCSSLTTTRSVVSRAPGCGASWARRPISLSTARSSDECLLPYVAISMDSVKMPRWHGHASRRAAPSRQPVKRGTRRRSQRRCGRSGCCLPLHGRGHLSAAADGPSRARKRAWTSAGSRRSVTIRPCRPCDPGAQVRCRS